MNTTKQILNFIIKEKAQGNTFQELNIQMRIMMKGVNVKGILEEKVPDDPALSEKLKAIAQEFDVDLKKMAAIN
ncbi:MAG: hypothetical protein LBL24_11130 [Bacteroidales bacterium]|jgi:hypothetical protein|nr:hypothetical protein [Bacteroidales bacterium]